MFGRKKTPKEANPFDATWGEGIAIVIGVNVLGYAMDWDGATCLFITLAGIGLCIAWKIRTGFAEAMRESTAERETLQAAYDAYAARVAGQQRIEALKRDIALAVQRVDILEAQEG